MNYAEALAYLQSFTDYEQVLRPDDPTRFQLGRVHALLALLGHPERRFGTIHIVGTKGKGSTAAMIAGALRAAGYRVGLFTSPHLHTFRERIQVDGRYIEGDALGEIAELVRPLVDREHREHPELGHLTTFEVTTALALAYFARSSVQHVVLEAGLGGRLDATNVVQPLVTVITPIGLDHTQYLGNTQAAIAREKAAVIKSGTVVVSAAQSEPVEEIVHQFAKEAGAPVAFVGREWDWEVLRSAPNAIAVYGLERTYPQIEVPLVGRHQRENAVLAVAALDALCQRGVLVPEEAVRQGIAAVRWPGRFEVLGEHPTLVVDGAHNPDSMRRLLETLVDAFDARAVILVLGVSVDKDIAGIMASIAPVASRVIVTRSRHPRSAPLERLAEEIAARHLSVDFAQSVPDALDLARRLAGPEDVICVTGSLFVVAEAREAILGQEATGADA